MILDRFEQAHDNDIQIYYVIYIKLFDKLRQILKLCF